MRRTLAALGFVALMLWGLPAAGAATLCFGMPATWTGGSGDDFKVGTAADEVFVGRIQYISDFFKEDTRTVTVFMEIANTDYKLKPGMFADITIHLNHHDRVLAVPRSAVLDDGPLKLVFVGRGNEYVPVVVETGIEEDGFVQVLSGIAEGDVVVTNGNFQLKSIMYEDLLEGGHTH